MPKLSVVSLTCLNVSLRRVPVDLYQARDLPEHWDCCQDVTPVVRQAAFSPQDTLAKEEDLEPSLPTAGSQIGFDQVHYSPTTIMKYSAIVLAAILGTAAAGKPQLSVSATHLRMLAVIVPV